MVKINTNFPSVMTLLQFTARRSYSGTNSDIWSEMRVVWPEMVLKLTICLWTFSSKQKLIASFKWGTIIFLISFYCKVMGHQRWESKEILDLLDPRLRFLWVYIVNCHSSRNPGSNPGRCNVWGYVTLQPFGLKANWVPLLKDLYIFHMDKAKPRT